uniref:UspA domain-containing protein n=1 Tax=Salix viminalis TaxID=40686 RepID=A0A6N2N8Y5_SALVM
MQEQVVQQPLKEVLIRKRMRIMVAIDESDGSFHSLKWALNHLVDEIAPTNVPSQEESSLITLVHVHHPFQHYVFPAGPGGAVRKAQAENDAVLLSRALQMCKDKMIKAESHILEGDPKDKICQATEQMQVDLLVLGSRGLGKIKRAFLGSVSDYCAHHAKCPVLIVKPPLEITKETSSKSKER